MKYLDENKGLLEEQLGDFGKEHKAAAIVVSILMLIGGIILIFKPLRGLIGLEYMISGLFCLFGVFLIYKYFSTKKENRLGWNLINGILIAMLGIFYLFSTPISTILTFSLIFAILSLCEGISDFMVYSKLKENGESNTWLAIFTGVLYILVSIFFVTNPFIMSLGVSFVIGIYFIIEGISLLAKALSGSNV
mgnify:FL=1